MESTAAPANTGSYNTSSKNSNTSSYRVYFKFLILRRSSKSSHICVKRVRIEVDTESLNKNPWLAVPSNRQEKDVMFYVSIRLDVNIEYRRRPYWRPENVLQII
jgi:hypothetical protein